MHAYPETIVCKFGRDPAICLGEEAICAKVYRRTDDGRLAIALAHSWNELINHHLAYIAITSELHFSQQVIKYMERLARQI